MATADIATPTAPQLGQLVEPFQDEKKSTQHNVQTTLNYYKQAEDGSPPAPAYVG